MIRGLHGTGSTPEGSLSFWKCKRSPPSTGTRPASSRRLSSSSLPRGCSAVTTRCTPGKLFRRSDPRGYAVHRTSTCSRTLSRRRSRHLRKLAATAIARLGGAVQHAGKDVPGRSEGTHYRLTSLYPGDAAIRAHRSVRGRPGASRSDDGTARPLPETQGVLLPSSARVPLKATRGRTVLLYLPQLSCTFALQRVRTHA